MNHEEFEKNVMNKLLEGETEFFVKFREQYEKSQVIKRDFTGCGFFTSFDVPLELEYENLNGRIDDVMATLINNAGESYFFILYIEKGRIDTLEGFTTMDSWVYDYDNVLIKYCYENERVIEIE